MNICSATDYLGKNVHILIDRPAGSAHPKDQSLVYPINYGYVPDTISGDGEELDAYLLGTEQPLQQAEGYCIAVIHRLNDQDDKLVLSLDGRDYTNEEIQTATFFQEQYFVSTILHRKLT